MEKPEVESVDSLVKLFSKKFGCDPVRLSAFVKDQTAENPGKVVCGMGDHKIENEETIHTFDGESYNLQSNFCSNLECFLSGLEEGTIDVLDGNDPNLKKPAKKKAKKRVNTPDGADEGDEITHIDYAREIMGEHYFLTLKDTGEILYYEDGRYRFGGEVVITEEAYKVVPVCRISILREIIQFIKADTFVEREIFDADPDIINVKNGLINIRTNEFMEHTPNIPSRQQLDVIYDKSARAEKFEQFMEQVMPDSQEKATICEMFAAPLLPKLNLELIMVCAGEGSNGKSTLLKIMDNLYGDDACSHVSIHDLIDNRFFRAYLDGKKLNICADISSDEMSDLKIIKSLVTREKITVEKKNLPPFDMINTASMFFSCNRLPDVKEDTDAVFRRFRILNFEQQFSGDQINPYLFDELLEEKSGILNILLSHARTLQENGRLTYGINIRQTRKEWREGVDTVQNFLSACTEDVQGQNVPKNELYQRYTKFCRGRGDLPKSNNGFSLKITSFGYTWRKMWHEGKGQNVWIDLKLKKEGNSRDKNGPGDGDEIRAVPHLETENPDVKSKDGDFVDVKPKDATDYENVTLGGKPEYVEGDEPGVGVFVDIFTNLAKSGDVDRKELAEEMVKSEKWNEMEAEKLIDNIIKSGRIKSVSEGRGGKFFCETCNAGPFTSGSMAFGGKKIEEYHKNHKTREIE